MLEDIRKIFPFTGQGFFFLLLALLLLAGGIPRADLAALFWSTTFLTLTVYAFTGSHLYRFLIKRYLLKNCSALRLYLPEKGVYPGEELNYKLEVKIPALIIPGFSCLCVAVFRGPGKKSFILKEQLKPGANNISASVTARTRGLYKNTHLEFLFRDVAGFTRSVYAHPAEEQVRIFPDTRKTASLTFKIQGTEATDKIKSKRASDELLEVRKYYPGDDTRKINWKMFAHSDELYLRKGEETPPPDSRLLFILDPTVSPLIPRQIRDEYLDTLIENCASLLFSQLAGDTTVLLTIPGRKSTFTYNNRNRQELIALLAEVDWLEQPQECAFPQKQRLEGIIFSAPGSLALPGIIKALKTRNWAVHLFLKNFQFPVVKQAKLQIRNIFFVPEKNEKPAYNPRWEKSFKSALSTELEKYKKQPWKVENIGIL